MVLGRALQPSDDDCELKARSHTWPLVRWFTLCGIQLGSNGSGEASVPSSTSIENSAWLIEYDPVVPGAVSAATLH